MNKEMDNRNSDNHIKDREESTDSGDIINQVSEFFPHRVIRKFQDKLIKDVYTAVDNRKSILINAPTGIGKTAGVLAPLLKIADLKNKERSKSERIKIFFLTSRHTQHKIVIETVKKINELHNKHLVVANIVGKRFLCGFDDAASFYSSDFNEYCRSLRENNKCDFYNNTFDKKSDEKKFSKPAYSVIEFLKQKPSDTSFIRKVSKDKILCPYEIACGVAKEADVIIADYNHIFNPGIREVFLRKVSAELENSIIIVDEAHNLAERLRSMLSQSINEFTVEHAFKEAKRFKLDIDEELSLFKDFFTMKAEEFKSDNSNRRRLNELLIDNSEIIDFIEERKFDVDKLVEELMSFGDEIRLKQRKSFIGRLGDFLDLINRTYEKEEFITILSLNRSVSKSYDKEERLDIEYFCTDPSLLSKEVIDNSISLVLMSATLSPLKMYSDILGFDEGETVLKSYENPFPKKNRLTLIIPETTTKYEFRNTAEYKKITIHLYNIINNVPGRTALFFPSYAIMKSVLNFLKKICKRKIFIEEKTQSKDEKNKLIKDFLNEENSILAGVVGASFSEGIDLPDKLKCVVIIGLPLKPPGVKVLKLISQYDERFGKGFDYGYVIPSMNKAIQSAGRCIRSENDTGALVFLDKRYLYEVYKNIMPIDWKLVITTNYIGELSNFFNSFNKDK